MSSPLPRVAAIVLTCAVLAGVIAGAPWSTAQEPEVRTAEPGPETIPAPESLDLDRLQREKSAGTVLDLFVAPAAPRAAGAEQQARAAISVPPPAPSAPPLPFRYLGRMVKGGETIVFLEHGPGVVSAAAGETVDNYRIESIAATSVAFVYLPLGVTQVLAIPGGP